MIEIYLILTSFTDPGHWFDFLFLLVKTKTKQKIT